MTTARLGAVRRVFDRIHAEADHGDGELLRRWECDRDERAFAGLVRRHGGMVLGVCRRVLRDPHAADDAFQATFLVLARKANAVRPPDLLGPWLHGVAYRTALKARGRELRRREVERDYARTLPAPPPPAADTADLRPLIDEQLNALPEKYRAPLVLCAVQGLGKAEAAARLGLPEGTVSSRLARAREALRERLARRGVVVPAAALAAVLTPDALRAAVPAAAATAVAEVAVGTAPVVPAVLSLSHEMIQAMSASYWKLAAVVAFAVALTGGGVGLYAAADEKKPGGEKPAVEKPKPAAEGEKPAKPNADKPKPAAEGDKPKPEGDRPRDGEKPRVVPAKLGGKIGSVDPKANTVTLVFTGDSGTREKVVPLADGAKVFIDNKPATLDAVKPGGMYASFAGTGRDGQPFQFTEVRVTGPTMTGLVTVVDAGSITVDVGGRESGPQPLLAKVTPQTRVVVNGKEAKVTDLKPGDKVSVVMATDGVTALQVSSGGRDGEKRPGTGDKPGVKKPGEGDRKPEKPDEKKPEKPGE